MKQPQARQLLLEQLESRSLLAGGIFAFSQPGHLFRESTETLRLENRFAAEVGRPQHSHADGSNSHDIVRVRIIELDGAHHPSPHGRAFPPPSLGSNEFVALAISPHPQSTNSRTTPLSISNTSEPIWNPVADDRDAGPRDSMGNTEMGNTELGRTQLGANRANGFSGASSMPMPSKPMSAPEADSMRVSSASFPVDTNASTAQLPSRGDQVNISQVATARLALTQTNGQVPAEPTRLSVASQEFVQRKLESATIARVSEAPLRGGTSAAVESQLPWKMPDNTLRELRDINDQQPLTVEGTNVDRAMAMWFDGPGGLIDFVAGDPLVAPSNSVDRVVDVGLDAIIGQHRSLELIASTVERVPDDNDVRAAVLAAIVRANRETPSIAEDRASASTSSWGVSGAMVVAGVAALAARRKRNNNVFQPKSLLHDDD